MTGRATGRANLGRPTSRIGPRPSRAPRKGWKTCAPAGPSKSDFARRPTYPGPRCCWALCEGDQSRIDCRLLHRAALAGDEYALREVRQVGRTVGLALSNVLSLINPERIAIGGGVSNMGELLLEPIRQSAREHEFISSAGHYEILPCELKESIVLVGAILLAQPLV